MNEDDKPETLRYATLVKRKPKAVADEVLEHCGQKGPEVVIDSVLEYFHIQKITEQLEGDGYLLELWDGTAEVLISKNTETTLRWKFTAAHELGHWLLNRFTENKDSISASIRKATHREIERWCNEFAGHLLVPESWLRGYVGKLENLSDWKYLIEGPKLFGVSIEFFEVRLSQVYGVGLINFGMSKGEPVIQSTMPGKLLANAQELKEELMKLSPPKLEGKYVIGPTNAKLGSRQFQVIFLNRRNVEPSITEYT